MKTMVVEDDYITSQVMQEIMLSFGECNIAENGLEALDLFNSSYNSGDRYDLVFLDIMMPEMDGQEVLSKIREFEASKAVLGLDGVKVIMTTALDDYKNIKSAFVSQAEGYIVKPIDKDKVIHILAKLELI